MSRWNPWRALRSRANIRFRLDQLPDATGGAVYGRRGEGAAIIVDRRLSQRDRSAALAHELVHDERGLRSMEAPPGWIVIREEGAVEKIVAERLLPVTTLRPYVDSMAELGEAVTALEVAEEFDVPLALAQRALALMKDAA